MKEALLLNGDPSQNDDLALHSARLFGPPRDPGRSAYVGPYNIGGTTCRINLSCAQTREQRNKWCLRDVTTNGAMLKLPREILVAQRWCQKSILFSGLSPGVDAYLRRKCTQALTPNMDVGGRRRSLLPSFRTHLVR